MEFLELARSRYSERYFDATRMIEDEKMSKILEAGRIAPTACNYQPQRIYVLKSDEALKKAASMTYIYNAPIVLLVCYDIDSVWKNPSDKYYDNFNTGEQDASIVASSMMFEAQDLGVHSIWLRDFDSKEVADGFELPNNVIPVMMLALGYPSDKSKAASMHTSKKELSETVREL